MPALRATTTTTTTTTRTNTPSTLGMRDTSTHNDQTCYGSYEYEQCWQKDPSFHTVIIPNHKQHVNNKLDLRKIALHWRVIYQ